jgi:hypothetical protein
LVCAVDGLWYYAIGRGIVNADGGTATQREVTDAIRPTWASFITPSTTISSGTNSQTQTVADNTSWFAGDTVYFATAKTTRTIQSTGVNTIVLDATVSTTTGETIYNTGARQRAVVTVFEDEIWAFCDRRGMKLNRQRQWEYMTLTEEVKALMGVPGRGLFWLGLHGKLYLWKSTQTTDDGTAIAWSYTTPILEGPRTQIRGLGMEYTGSPTVQVQVWDGATGTQTVTASFPSGQKFAKALNIRPGYRYQFTFSGTSASDSITSLEVWYEEIDPGFGN